MSMDRHGVWSRCSKPSQQETAGENKEDLDRVVMGRERAKASKSQRPELSKRAQGLAGGLPVFICQPASLLTSTGLSAEPGTLQ